MTELVPFTFTATAKRKRVRVPEEELRPSRFQVLEGTSVVPNDPIEIDLQAPAVTSLGPQVSLNQFRRQPSFRVAVRRKLTERKKTLKKELKQCEKDCRSLCNKKVTKGRKKKTTKKKKKKNAKKGKK